MNFTVGDLIANTNYLVRKANVAFVNLTANASGLLQISDTATTTNPIVYSVETLNTNLATLQYSASLNKIYLKNNGVATLSDIRAALPTAPLSLVDTNNKIWLLSADSSLATSPSRRRRAPPIV